MAAATTGPTTEAPLVVGGVEGEGLRTNPSLARGGRSESWREWGSLTRATTLITRGKGGNEYRSRLTECILEDCLGIRDMGTVQGELRIVTRRKQVDRWRAPTTKQVSHHPRVERQLGPYNLIPTAEEICQNIGLPWRRWDLTIHQDKSFLTSHYKGTGREGGSDSGDQFVFKCHCRECIRRRLRGANLSSEAR